MTHSVSTAVIVFELTGQLSHLVPVLLATVIAYSVAGTSSISIYDLMLNLKQLPFLTRAHAQGQYQRTAQVRGISYLLCLNQRVATVADKLRGAGCDA